MRQKSQSSGLLAALSAIRNASPTPATALDVERILRTGAGHPSHVRALFSDTSLDTLIRLGIAMVIPTATVLAAYRIAGATGGATNAEIEGAGLG